MRSVSLGILLMAAGAAPGQPPAGAVTSPEVHPDRRVTFRVRALKAAEVTLTADWLPAGRTEKLTRDAAGVWSVTVGPLAPGVAIYNFTVDGLPVADPVNPRVKLPSRIWYRPDKSGRQTPSSLQPRCSRGQWASGSRVDCWRYSSPRTCYSLLTRQLSI